MRGIAVLAEVASDSTANDDARARAMHGLAQSRACGEIGRLRQLALDPSRAVSVPANAALWSLHMPCGTPDRSQAELGQIQAVLRAGGARAVAAAESIGGSDASDTALVPALIACLSDAAPSLRAAAVSALSRVGPRARAATPTLLGLLRDPSESVRRRAIMALGRIGPDVGPEAIAALRALRDDDTVYHEVRDALAAIEPSQR
jgi:hypothetical protein